MSRNTLSFILENAILYAVQNPPQPIVNTNNSIDFNEIDENTPVEQPVDFFAYNDAIQFLYETFAAQKGVVVELGQEQIVTQDMIDSVSTALYSIDQSSDIDRTPDENGMVIASHHVILAMKYIEKDTYKKQVGRMLGINNHYKTTDEFFKGKDGVLIQPYELTTLVKESSLGGVSVDTAYKQNPLHPCFVHLIQPASVAGFALECSLKGLIGYVVHAKLMYNLLKNANILPKELHNEEFSLKHHMALQYDTQTALRLLEHRYHIDVDKESLDQIAEFDKKLKHYEKGVCSIEFPNT